MLQALIFDMDGLMIDTEPLYWAVQREMARGYGREVSDATLRRMMGRGRMDSITIFATETGIPDTPEALLARREELMLERYRGRVEPMRGLRDMLTRYHRKLKLAVATSSPRIFTDAALPNMGLSDYFDVITTGDEIAHGKPDPEIYLTTMQRLGVPPQSCVVLEDSCAGALAGHRAGARVIAIPTALTADQDFSFVPYRCHDLLDAMDIVEGLLRRAHP